MRFRKKYVSIVVVMSMIFSLCISVMSVGSMNAQASEQKEANADNWKSQWVNHDWKAQWIWDSKQSKSNTWMSFRKTFQLEKKPDSAKTKIAVDSKYWLWVNDQLVVFEGGLKRGPAPEDTYYDEIDIAPYLKSGKNTVAVLVTYFGVDGFSHKSSGQGGFLFESELDGMLLKSDHTWKVKLNGAYKDDPVKPNYRLSESNVFYDARDELGEWYKSDADDSNWGNAVELGAPPTAPWNDLWKRPIPMFKDYGLKDYINAESFPKTSDGSVITAKLPYNAQFTPYLKVKAPAGKTILMEPDSYNVPAGPAIRATYLTKEGIQEYESLGWMNGQEIKYVIPKGVEIISLQFRETGYNTEFKGSFSSDDDFLNKLWQKSLRTLYITMRDNYMDCPDRERAQWWGDAVNEMEMSYYSLDTNAYLLAEKGMSNIIEWRSPQGAYPTISPYGLNFFELPAQMLAGVMAFWTHYEYTGNKELIEYAYPSVKQYLGLYEFDGEGLVIHRTGTWDWSDWGSEVDQRLITNGWYYIALDSALKMAELTGNRADVSLYRMKMASIEKNFNRVFWNGSEYRSPGYNGATDDRGNALAVVAGLADSSEYAKLKKVFQTQFHASPYMEKYVLEALFLIGDEKEALLRMKSRYADMVNDSYSTLWEQWNKNDGTKNHAWSGHPLTIMSKYVTGVSPIDPGYAKYEVVPKLGTLNKVDTIVPTLKGEIKVSIDKSSSEFHMSVVSPDQTLARIGIPRFGTDNTTISAGDQVIWEDGRFVGQLEGIHYESNDEKYVYFNVIPGKWHFNASIKESGPADAKYALAINEAKGGSIRINGAAVSIPYNGIFTKGEEVLVEAIAESGNAFSRWDGSLASSIQSITVKMDSNKTLNAQFRPVESEKYYELQIGSSQNTGGIVKINGEPYSIPYRGLFDKGESITVEALPKDELNYAFLRWEGDITGSTNPVALRMDRNLQLSANYKFIGLPNLALGKAVQTNNSLEIPPAWSFRNLTDGIQTSTGSVSGFTTNVYPSRDISSSPHWIEIDLGAEMDVNQVRLYPRTNALTKDGLTPNFPTDFTIQVKSTDGNYITAKKITEQPNPQGEVQVYPFELQHARFIKINTTKLGLPAGDEGAANSYRIQLAEITVHNSDDVRKEAKLQIGKDGDGQVKINGALYSLPYQQIFDKGTDIIIEALPSSNNTFKGWTEGIIGTNNPLYITLNTDLSLTAKFDFAADNLALNKSVKAINSDGGASQWSPAYLTDGIQISTGNTGSEGVKGYTSKGYPSRDITNSPHWIEIDLGKDVEFNQLRLYPRTDALAEGGLTPNFPTDFTIQVKPEAGGYVVAKTITGQANPQGKPQIYTFDMKRARYVQINTTLLGLPTTDEGPNLKDRFRVQLAEIEVYRINSDKELTTSLTGSDSANSGQAWTLKYGLSGTDSIAEQGVFAQDLTINYDPNMLDFVSAKSLLDGVEVVRTDVRKPGEVRILIASLGADHAVKADGDLLQLNWLSHSVTQSASSTVSLTKAVLGDRLGNEVSAKGASHTVRIAAANPGDINGDGKVSIGDLALVAKYYGKTKDDTDWESAKVADINGDGKIGLEDLVAVAQRILQELQ